jgi:hypothetical protein
MGRFGFGWRDMLVESEQAKERKQFKSRDSESSVRRLQEITPDRDS